MENKGDLRTVFSGLTGENPDTYKPGVFTREDIIDGIKQRRPDLSEKEIKEEVDGLHADKVIDKLVNEMENEEKKHERHRTRKAGPVHRTKEQMMAEKESESPKKRRTPDPLGDGVRQSGFAGMMGNLFGTDRDF